MTNPFVHALVFAAAVLVPGGLLVYFAWRCSRNASSSKAEPNHTAQNQGSGDIPEVPLPTPDEAREAFRNMFPKDSLRARSRIRRLQAYRRRPGKKSQ
jgi:hypothetical protein